MMPGHQASQGSSIDPRLLRLRHAGFLVLAIVALGSWLVQGVGARWEGAVSIADGDLSVVVRDNSRSPQILSGIGSLVNVSAAAGFDAIDPDNPAASAGLNFEHVISGHRNPANAFSPRAGPFELLPVGEPGSVRLVRRAEDDPWALSSEFTYKITPPYAIDFEFVCRARDASRFGERGYAVLFFANYMNDVEEIPIHFMGVDGPHAKERWLHSDAPPEHPDYVEGGTFRSRDSAPLSYDEDHNLKLNLWSYEYPRFTRPFYYGRAAHGMVFLLMFDRAWSPIDEIRFSLFKFKTWRVPRPAWDFEYVIRRVETGRVYGFRGRLIWKKFVSREDCEMEYLRWQRSIVPPGERGPEASLYYGAPTG